MIDEILSVLEKLISFKSVTPKGDDAIKFVADYLQKLGFKCLIKTFGPKEQKVTNLYAALGDEMPNICFAGHIDVVPPGETSLWESDPFQMRVKDDLVFGRGAVDMKGAIACSLVAVSNFLSENKNHNGTISFLLTTDEEGDGTHGLKEMLEYIQDITPKIDFCILGESTTRHEVGDTIKIGRRGSINFDLTVKGKQGHVAYPEKAINPMPILISILKDLVEAQLDSGSEFFQKSNLEVTSIEGQNIVRNVIPALVNAKFNIRFNEKHIPSELATKIVHIISKYSDDYDLQYSCTSLPFVQTYSKEMQHFADIVYDTCGIQPKIDTGGGTSDARFIHKYTQVVEFGLNCDLAHKIDEHTKICDLQTLYNVYYSSLVKLL